MKMDSKDDNNSDEEVFFGKLTLREVKKHILRDVRQKQLYRAAAGDHNIYDTFKIIETTSEPNIVLRKDTGHSPSKEFKSSSDPHFDRHQKKPLQELECEDSFLEFEKNVTDQCMSLTKANNLDNTLDAIDFILNNAPSYHRERELTTDVNKPSTTENSLMHNTDVPKDTILSQSASLESNKKSKDQLPKSISSEVTPVTIPPVIHNGSSAAKNNLVSANIKNTPISQKKIQYTFKTPKQPISCRKDTVCLKTPSRTKAFEHIPSPIATYIKNSPQTPLVKRVCPKKPLPSVSSIPKLMRSGSEIKTSNKENVALPSLAYRSAKKTTVMNVNKDKWPQNNWPKKLASSLPKAIVLKHDHRESAKKPLVSQLDSFADLTLHQADVSICTQKIAFNNP